MWRAILISPFSKQNKKKGKDEKCQLGNAIAGISLRLLFDAHDMHILCCILAVHAARNV